MRPLSLTLLLAPLLLVGCDKLLPIPLLGHTPPKGPITVLGMGQSNMAGWANGTADLTKAFGRPVVFVNCALGGTYIRQWNVGGSLFEACMGAVQNVDLVVFYQGESDSQSDGDSATWAQKFTPIALTILAQKHSPLIFVQIGDDPGPGPTPITDPTGGRWLAWAAVQGQQSQVSISGVKMVQAAGLATGDDHIHLLATSYPELAARLARVFNTWGD